MACMKLPMPDAAIYTDDKLMRRLLIDFSSIDEIIEIRMEVPSNFQMNDICSDLQLNNNEICLRT